MVWKHPLKTHLFNSLTLLLPDAEQYIIRDIRRQLKQISKPQLKQKVRAFISQEGEPSIQNTKFWDNLRLQGYEIDTYIHFVQAIFLNTLERRLSIKLNLAIITRGKYLTTLLAEFALEENFLPEAEPRLRKLLSGMVQRKLNTNQSPMMFFKMRPIITRFTYWVYSYPTV